MGKKKIAITMGDPAGIGPEIIVKALTSDKIKGKIIPVVVAGRNVMEEAVMLVNADIEFVEDTEKGFTELSGNMVYLADTGNTPDFPKSGTTGEGGEASVKCIKKAVEMCMKREVDAMVTAPISKEAVHLAGYGWPGHTEMLAEFTGAERVSMMFLGERLKVILVTIHTSLRNAVNMISEQSVAGTIRTALEACRNLSIESPRIAVAGLNPHAGEGGLFGNEEELHIIPAIEKERAEGINVAGPFPPDIVFKKALEDEFDIVVAMYHDQGLIPFKLMHFDSGVNVTIGLPVIRTSPDHGTACDIAWKGVANPSSMIEAILVAERMKL
ncbi:4-hydroxythreonine-4-phosphate dehydrogenase 2 [bacterium BMS3Abin07]|nr:4-hydroxythreonine-4-phosphate dehydrogenase 2 [bacterium BMS3Abin07]GBE33095.1 4-hydroxythreonine-4-phosphate dehydrogenase 2 [bacterium BMS3Bbin05]HDL20725.1 4-hydroxythreonine-4-phosphate dehydrogenase PdxA [Nitrospirota bacterium]HDO21774.1 4-hydroxythreonine-4-phosphate dehydrogenase PdxA [Nitrospirota bacterium]HDZ87583.1 4-hydroxythreonine-4-phosphate dehydrogenase PdxA [Nitrospirota bacterium]